MELYVREYLGGQYDVVGGLEEGTQAQQQLYFLTKKNGAVANVEVCVCVGRAGIGGSSLLLLRSKQGYFWIRVQHFKT